MRIHLKKILPGLFIGLFLLLPGCDWFRPEPIRIGFVAGLIGRTASVGIAARDGAQIAVDEFNNSGGLKGRQVELIVRDIQQDGVVGLNAVGELIEAKVPAIIGPMTSTMALILAPAVNNSETIMVSPTAATPLLGEKDDNFFRLRPQSTFVAHKLANYVVKDRKLRRLAVIYDTSNSAYTHTWRNSFSEQLTSLGAEMVAAVAFDSLGLHSFYELIEQILPEKPDGVLLLSNSLDTAMLTQQLMKKEVKLPIFASEWSMTRDLLSSGGRSIEGMAMFHVFNEMSRKQKYLDFREKYQKRFKQELSFPVVHAYDATQIVLEGLKNGALNGPELKKTLLMQDSFDTLQSNVSFDQYGDVKRELYLTIVQNGKFVVVE